jgi:hypothetical protein
MQKTASYYNLIDINVKSDHDALSVESRPIYRRDANRLLIDVHIHKPEIESREVVGQRRYSNTDIFDRVAHVNCMNGSAHDHQQNDAVVENYSRVTVSLPGTGS